MSAANAAGNVAAVIQARNAERNNAIIAAADQTAVMVGDVAVLGPAAVVVAAALSELANQLYGEAAAIREARKKGHVSAANEYDNAAEKVSAVAVSMRTQHEREINAGPPGVRRPPVTLDPGGSLAAPKAPAAARENQCPNTPPGSPDVRCIQEAGHVVRVCVGERGDRWPTPAAVPVVAPVAAPLDVTVTPAVAATIRLNLDGVDTVAYTPAVPIEQTPPRADGIATADLDGTDSTAATAAYLRGEGDPPMTAQPVPVGAPPLAQRSEAMSHSAAINAPADPFGDPAPPGGSNGFAYTGPRFTFAELLNPAGGESPGHRSHSQVETYTDCALKYRLQRREGVPERPSWALIGGNAFHAAVATLEHLAVDYAVPESTAPQWALEWTNALSAEIVRTSIEAAGGPFVNQQTWHASNGGREGYTWWLVEGEAMLRAYVVRREDFGKRWQLERTPNGAPIIEFESIMDIYGVPFKLVIDQVWRDRATGDLLVRDLKSGRSAPTETYQLGEYAHALAQLQLIGQVRQPIERILGSYYLARKGIDTEPIDALLTHSWDEIVYRTDSMDRAERAGLYPPRPSSFCGGCSVRAACPAWSTGGR